MTTFKSDFLNVLQSRGFIHQISDPDSLDALAAKRELVAYIGFDCTAPSLHVGSMVQIMCLYWLQQTGNKPIALMGGGSLFRQGSATPYNYREIRMIRVAHK